MSEEAIYSSLETVLINHTFTNPSTNASGIHRITTRKLDELAHSEAEAFIIKNCTINGRKGSFELRYLDVPLGSINSMGFPNLGFFYYLECAPVYEKVQGNQNRSLFLSIAGMSVWENLEMLERIEKSGFNGIARLNLSCPDVSGKPQLAYGFGIIYETLREVLSIFSKPLGIKLLPYFGFARSDQMADILNQFPLACVNAINSVGNGLYINTEQEAVVIKPREGFGDIGREYIKLAVLANACVFCTRLKPEIRIIGTGGIRTRQDAFEHLLCGASMLQTGTELHKKGPEALSRVIKELTQTISEKRYMSAGEFKGKLRTTSW